MNKRNLFIFFLQIFTFSCVIGQDYSLFSYNKIFNIDYFTGNSLSQIMKFCKITTLLKA